MMVCLRALVGIMLVLTLSHCRTADSKDSASLRDYETRHLFVGCVPFQSECKSSCPHRDGQGVENQLLCPDTSLPVACTCPIEGYVSPKPPSDDTHRFVGCLPSANECRQSCNSRKIVTFQGSDRCEKFEFACYCEH